MPTIASHRHTTSSRRPGVDIAGTVQVQLVQLETCPACGSRTYVPGPWHGHIHGALPCGHPGRVNCVRQPLAPCETCGGAA